MVVAEVPLWVFHKSSLNGAPTGSDLSAPNSKEQLKKRAAQSLSLLTERRTAIYSIDCHPEGKIFATAGGDGTVRLWNTAALFPSTGRGHWEANSGYVSNSSDGGASSEDEAESVVLSSPAAVHDLSSLVRRKNEDPEGPRSPPPQKSTTTMSSPAAPLLCGSPSPSKKTARLLTTLNAHTGSSVLVCRFSNNHEYSLASAGDDGVVCIYKQNDEGEWHRVRVCHGHGLDVVDLAWAPDDSHLVSCSIDSETPIIVWKTSDLKKSSSSTNLILHPFKIIGKNIHTSTVKGLAFDPAGSYLASSGDDPAICIWRVHDESWGLEERIESIFRRWNSEEGQQSQLFRRISWSTDGAFLCATHAVVKNKHVACTISRDGWTTNSNEGGAATLVGHKQPIVVSRHAPQLLDARAQNEDDEDQPLEYGTLVALGDKQGFVTVWSTRQSRPIFKLQCSETRVTVTDLSWGLINSGEKKNLMLLVTMLDGQVACLKFDQDELGPLLSKEDLSRVFQMRYGMDIDAGTGNASSSSMMFVGKKAQFIESAAVQMSLEDYQDEEDDLTNLDEEEEDDEPPPPVASPPKQQETTIVGGKKRIRPVFMNVAAPAAEKKRPKVAPAEKQQRRKSIDPVQNALQAAEKASAVTKSADAATTAITAVNTNDDTRPVASSPHRQNPNHRSAMVVQGSPHSLGVTMIPHSTDRIRTVDLPLQETDQTKPGFTVECTNSRKVPSSSTGNAVQCVDVSICQQGKVSWRDQIIGTSCSALAASKSFFALGTTDGSLFLFATSPALGWTCGNSFRSIPPLIFGQPIVTLQLKESEEEAGSIDMLVVTADGNFSVYSLLPDLKLQYKGSIMTAMTHLALSSNVPSAEMRLPRLHRMQLTDTGRLILLLSLDMAVARNGGSTGTPGSARIGSTGTSDSVGGSLQAFLYDKLSELWMRIADSRFVLSDFYSSLPSSTSKASSLSGPLAKLDDAVRFGALHSSLKAAHHGRQADTMYDDSSRGYIATRSHCEDRMACAMALRSAR
jgi:protein HIRA/HIR1